MSLHSDAKCAIKRRYEDAQYHRSARESLGSVGESQAGRGYWDYLGQPNHPTEADASSRLGGQLRLSEIWSHTGGMGKIQGPYGKPPRQGEVRDVQRQI